MRAISGRLVITAISLGFLASFSPVPATAADLGIRTSGPAAIGNCSEIVFTCENGQQYPLCPIAVSIVGEVVTGSLYTGGRYPTHVRMIPMGGGIPLAGRGIWRAGSAGKACL